MTLLRYLSTRDNIGTASLSSIISSTNNDEETLKNHTSFLKTFRGSNIISRVKKAAGMQSEGSIIISTAFHHKTIYSQVVCFHSMKHYFTRIYMILIHKYCDLLHPALVKNIQLNTTNYRYDLLMI